MLKVRVLSALLLLPLVLAVFLFGHHWLILAFLSLCGALAVREAASMLFPAFSARFSGSLTKAELASVAPMPAPLPSVGHGRVMVVVAVAIGILMIVGSGLSDAEASKGLILACLLASFVIGSISAPTIEAKAAYGFALLAALCIGALPWIVVWDLYLLGPGARYIILVMAIAWCGDTGGYFGGRFLGGRLFGSGKMAPVISPNKTWEGAFFGLLMSIVGAFLINRMYDGAIGGDGAILLCGLFGGVFEQLGDLTESTLKRFARVKDSGALIPGHGGFLDRVDGILFAAPVIWLILYYLR